MDTSAYLALANDHDRSHQQAIALLRVLTNHHTRLFTTSFILAETHALLLDRVNRSITFDDDFAQYGLIQLTPELL